MPSRRDLALLAIAILLATGIAYAFRWRYLGGERPVRVNRWTDRTEYLDNAGWTLVYSDPFKDIGDVKHPAH